MVPSVADGGVLRDHLPGADLRRLRHGDLMVEPGGGDHPLALPLQLAHRPVHHIAHAVDEPDPEGGSALHRHAHCVLRDEFRLRRHDGPAGAALGQLVPGPLPAVHVVDAGNDQRLHKPFDKGGFSGADRPHDADVDVALGPEGNILIDFAVFHCDSSFGLICQPVVSLSFYWDKQWNMTWKSPGRP